MYIKFLLQNSFMWIVINILTGITNILQEKSNLVFPCWTEMILKLNYCSQSLRTCVANQAFSKIDIKFEAIEIPNSLDVCAPYSELAWSINVLNFYETTQSQFIFYIWFASSIWHLLYSITYNFFISSLYEPLLLDYIYLIAFVYLKKGKITVLILEGDL